MSQVTCCQQTRQYRFDHTLTLESNLKAIGRARDFVNQLLETCAYGPRDIMNVCLALEEALMNAVEHGNLGGQPTVEVGATINKTVCILQVVDFGGNTFNPEYFEKLAEIKDWGMGGRGIFLIKRLMDEVYFFFHPGRSTAVVMIKNRIGAESS